jgi:amino-acid N-acetyltransferase
MESYEIVAAAPRDWQRIASLLHESGLPIDGLRVHLATTIVAVDGDHIVGCAALEIFGPDALLRSVAVAPTHRGRGMGNALTAAMLAVARTHGVRALYLLTETATEFFPRFGFTTTTRDAVPAAVRQSVEFTTACPESATVMTLPLRSAAS